MPPVQIDRIVLQTWRAILRHLGLQLREMYTHVFFPPVPDKISTLVCQLDRKDLESYQVIVSKREQRAFRSQAN